MIEPLAEKSSTGSSLGVHPLLEALELAKTNQTLLEEFELISENIKDDK